MEITIHGWIILPIWEVWALAAQLDLDLGPVDLFLVHGSWGGIGPL